MTLECTTPDATIHYTTDGTTPTESSPVYSTAISISGVETSGSKTVKAIAVKDGMDDSEVMTITYTNTGA